ncbi:phosphoglycolate phosphatase [Pseudoduganella namucuonensis]|uniref:Phosphoglycolate phosphatase n=1 Tax=Pseudoduganella namucuonensis TaxID=1035707 RepID=A0A1I7M1H8_9BURK|nr:phosphoglycolate phosphatase [Pseudoduganella namucuonensis]SFV15798.1 phosphoglycolate phosphatase [Pseudoduganella namucuonensis]
MTAATNTPLSGVRAAIIDLDGTMLDTVPDFHVAINRMRAELQKRGQVQFPREAAEPGQAGKANLTPFSPLSAERIKLMVGKGSENLIRSVLALDYDEAGVELHFEAAMDAYQRHYLDINGDHSALYPDVAAGLEALKAHGLRLACVTNKPIAFAAPLLEQKGLAGYFEVVYGGDSLEKKKPHPMPLLRVCSDFALRPAQVVAIGDSSNDAQAARAAGCPVLTVPYGYNHGESIHDTDSDGIVDTLLHAAHLIRLHNPIAN